MMKEEVPDETPEVDINYRYDGGLFNLSRFRARRNITGSKISEIQYADDMATAASSVEEIEHSVETFTRAYDRYGLTVNAAKTKILSQPAPGEKIQQPVIRVSGSTVENVAHFPYLGSTLTADATQTLLIASKRPRLHMES